MDRTLPWGETSADPPTQPPLRPARGWRVWLVPRPFAWIATLVYLGLLGLLLTGDCRACAAEGGRGALALGAILALLALDRLEVWRWGEIPPTRVALGLLAGRVLLIEMLAVAWGAWPGLAWPVLWLYGLLPYTAFLYFGARGGTLVGLAAWTIIVARFTLQGLTQGATVTVYQGGTTSQYVIPDLAFHYFAWGQYLNNVTGYSLLIFFVITTAWIVAEERAYRVRAERLLATLEDAHRLGREYAAQALAATQARNAVARAIHERLERDLAAADAHLATALAQRTVDPAGAEQAVHAAKRLAGEALQDVRRSVGTLRAGRDTVAIPALPDPPAAPPLVRRGWHFWLAPRRFDRLSTAVYVAILILWIGGELSWAPGIMDTWDDVGFISLVAGLLVLDRVEYRLFGEVPPPRAATVLLGVRLLGVAFGVLVLHSWWSLWFLPLVAYLAGVYLGSGRNYLANWLIGGVAAIGIVALLGLPTVGSPDFDFAAAVNTAIAVSIAMLLISATSLMVLQERASRQRAEALRAELAASHQDVQEGAARALAAVQARNQLAWDIHDGLGHYLTVINVQLEKALAFRAVDAALADAALHDARRLTSEALLEVSDSVGALHAADTVFSLQTALSLLARRLEGGPLTLDLQITGDERGFARPALTALYRAAQEGLTNIQRHAGAAHARVTLRFTPDEAVLDIRDDGRGLGVPAAGAGDPAAGSGLQSMRERLELVGGAVAVESAAGQGTWLRVTVPGDSQPRLTPSSLPQPVPAEGVSV